MNENTTKAQSRDPSRIRYAIVIGIVFLLSLPLVEWASDLYAKAFLSRVGEAVSIGWVVEKQQRRQGLYGSAIFEDEFAYKLELIRTRKPAVVALGSSRALQFRSEFFRVPFTNAGRGMNALEEGKRFVDEMLGIHKPELVILTVDLWWFNEARKYVGTATRDLDNDSRLASLFWGFVDSRKITMPQSLMLLMGVQTNPISSRNPIGIAALIRGRGFRPDGSRDYGARYFGSDAAFDDAQFENSIRRARSGASLLAHGDTYSLPRLRLLGSIVATLQQAEVAVVLVLPPFAQRVLKVMEGESFGYMADARQAIRGLPVPVFDFTDPATVDAGDCEFADGLHGGDVLYQRMLLKMADAETVSDFVDKSFLTNNIASYQGHAVTPMSADGYRFFEVDFLMLGCLKSMSSH